MVRASTAAAARRLLLSVVLAQATRKECGLRRTEVELARLSACALLQRRQRPRSQHVPAALSFRVLVLSLLAGVRSLVFFCWFSGHVLVDCGLPLHCSVFTPAARTLKHPNETTHLGGQGGGEGATGGGREAEEGRQGEADKSRQRAAIFRRYVRCWVHVCRLVARDLSAVYMVTELV